MKTLCYGLSIYVPLKFILKLNLQCGNLRGVAFTRYIHHEGISSMHGIKDHIKETSQNSAFLLFHSFHCVTTQHSSPSENTATRLHLASRNTGPSPYIKPTDSLILDFSVSRTARNTFWVFINFSVCDILL